MAAKKRKTVKKAAPKKRKTAAARSRRKMDLGWLKKVGFAVGVVFVFSWCVAWFFLSDLDNRAVQWMKTKTLDVTSSSGFTVDEILVDGRKYSDSDALLALINVQKGDPIFALNPVDAKEQIERISWVKSVRVERRLPNTVYVALIEREPVALWQEGDSVSVIDAEGNVLTQSNLTAFKALPMIRGDGAPAKAEALFSALSKFPKFEKQADHMVLIDDRRWDIVLKSGIRIKLPEKKVSDALDHLMKRHEENHLLMQDTVSDIDARYKGRLIVRTKLGKVQDYKAGYTEVGTQL